MNDERRIEAVLSGMRAMLDEAGIQNSAVDAEILMAHVLGESRGRVQALSIMGRNLTENQVQRALDLAEERARRVPLQHLTGVAWFRSIELEVGPGVFVPRPETEMVAGLAIEALREARNRGEPGPVAVDLCTGSGAIALSIATEVPGATVHAVELSPEAHAWASRNVQAVGGGRVTLHLGDATRAAELLPALRGGVQVLVSNPPYVPDDMVPRDPEVRDHDPALALYGGTDGLDLVRKISRAGIELVAPGGTIVLEHAEGQAAAIRALLAADGWHDPATFPDLTGRDRATTAIR